MSIISDASTATLMVENSLKSRRTRALGLATALFDEEFPETLLYEEAVGNVADYAANDENWPAIFPVLKQTIKLMFPIKNDANPVRPQHLPRLDEEPYSLFDDAEAPIRIERFITFIVDHITAIIDAEDALIVPNSKDKLPRTDSAASLSEENVALEKAILKNKQQEAKTLKDSFTELPSKLRKYDNNNSTKYPFHVHLREFKNKILYFQTCYSAGFEYLNLISSNNLFLTDKYLRVIFEQTLEYITKEQLDNSLTTANFIFVSFPQYITHLETIFNSESQLVTDITTHLKSDKIMKGDAEPAKLIARFDDYILKNSSLPEAQRLAQRQIKQYFIDAVNRGQNPHNSGLAIYLSKQIGASNDWTIIKQQFLDCLNNDQSIYHSDCPSSAACREEDVIDLSTATSYRNPKPTKPLPTVTSVFETQMLQFMERQNTILQTLTTNNGSTNRSNIAPRRIFNTPNANWQSWTPVELQKAKDDAAIVEGCPLGSKGPWTESDPLCTHCNRSHHSANCRTFYPWLIRPVTNYIRNNNFRGRGRGGYGRGYPRRTNQPYTKQH